MLFGFCLLCAGSLGLSAQESGDDQASSNAPTAQNGQTSNGVGQPSSTPQTAPPVPAAGEGVAAREIANQVNNPAAPLSLIQFRNILLPSASAPGLFPGVAGASGTVNDFQIQPVLPIGPFHSLPFVQLLKITMPVAVTLPSPVSQTGVGDLQVFDLLTIKQSWGRWGLGPALVFPTASSTALGAGKWQAGPSFALIVTAIKNLTAGAVLQNPISYAGSPDRPKVNSLIITPTLTYSLEKGWFVGLSDYNWSFNWENGGAALIPLGVQIGKVFSIGGQAFSGSIEAGRAPVRPAGTLDPGWIVGFEFSPIFKWHLGPDEKVRVKVKK